MPDMTDERSPEDYSAADAMLAEAPGPNSTPNLTLPITPALTLALALTP